MLPTEPNFDEDAGARLRGGGAAPTGTADVARPMRRPWSLPDRDHHVGVAPGRASRHSSTVGNEHEADDVRRVENALGQDWVTLRSVVARWIEGHRSELQAQWDFTMTDDDLISFELGAYLYGPTDDRQFDSPYDATPQEAFTFASTGIDGQHYNVLVTPDAMGVVVLTSPMAFDCENLVVGGSLRELLDLACTCGLGVVPDLAVIDIDRAVDLLTSCEQRSGLLVDLASEMGLALWPDVPRRLGELQREFGRYVQPSRPPD